MRFQPWRGRIEKSEGTPSLFDDCVRVVTGLFAQPGVDGYAHRVGHTLATSSKAGLVYICQGELVTGHQLDVVASRGDPRCGLSDRAMIVAPGDVD